MTDLPAPLVPPEVDLRDFSFMPLKVARLRDSNLAAVPDGEVFRANVLSWCVAWHQVPAASLPDDDPTLARMLGYGRDLRTWRKVRATGGLRGWVKCTDGRLYHPVVAELARDAWASKQDQRQRTEAAREAKRQAQQQRKQQSLSQTTRDLLSQTHDPPVTGSKGEGQGELRDRKKDPSLRSGEHAQGAPNGRQSRKSRIPTAWQPDEQDIRYAASKGFDRAWCDRETEPFRDYHLKTGKSYEWHAAWRTWVQKAPEFARNGAAVQRTGPATGIADGFAAALARERDEDSGGNLPLARPLLGRS